MPKFSPEQNQEWRVFAVPIADFLAIASTLQFLDALRKLSKNILVYGYTL